MKGSLDEAFKREIKELIIEECDLADRFRPEDIRDDEPLFGRNSRIGLDSIDALQISIAVQRYNVNITDSKVMRRVMTSIDAFADYLRPE
jgi:acyl carrier protein